MIHFTRILIALSALAVLFLAACGQVITRPTPAPASATPTRTPTAAATSLPTATPAPYTPAPSPTPTVSPTPILHAVVSGETLIAIANRYGVSTQAIQDANGIVDPRSLRIGQQLIIPGDSAVIVADSSPTPAPTPLPVTISPIYFGSSPTGGLWAFGEATNAASEPVESVKVTLTLLDAAGQPLATGEGLLLVGELAAGERGPFSVFFPDPPTEFSNYLVEAVSAFPAHADVIYRDLAVVEPEGESERNQSYLVRGRLRNIGPEQAANLRLTVTLYDALDQIIGMRQMTFDAASLAPDQEIPFTMELIPLGGPVARFTIIPEANRLPISAPQS